MNITANEFRLMSWVYLCAAAADAGQEQPLAPYPTLPEIVESREAA